MIRHVSILSSVLFLCLNLLLAQCGSSDAGNERLGRLPASWVKYLTVGTITATLDVYRENGE
ncbi:MAG TPA: hypothetical protein VFW62_00880, partial [bacterium]|nr:hypothetical protein [bacterium]